MFLSGMPKSGFVKYLINDDDILEWIRLLEEAQKTENYSCISYILMCLKREIEE